MKSAGVKTKHTPGPWQMHVCDKAIATITGDTRGWGHDHLAYVPMSLAPEREANANLIAAAPELLAFAEHVLKSGACQGIAGLEGYAHLVIAKALGGPTEPTQERADFVRKATGGAE